MNNQIDSSKTQAMRHKNWMDFQPLNSKCKGVIISLHGLNHNPIDMDDLCERVASHGYYVIRGFLTGHGGLDDNMIVEAPFWRDDTLQLIEYGKTIAKHHNVELYTLGFSTGNLCFLNALKSHPEHEIKKMIMVAPPLSFTLLGKMARTFSYLPKNTYIPSPDPDSLSRACERLNASYYRAFFKTQDEFLNNIGAHHNIPSLLIGHINDEIIATKKFDAFIKKHEMNNWESHFLYDEKIRNDSFFHVIVSTHYWGSIANKIAQKSVFWLEQ